ncbi:MAG: discoidin domain-containing protein [Bacteroidales bacterium]
MKGVLIIGIKAYDGFRGMYSKTFKRSAIRACLWILPCLLSLTLIFPATANGQNSELLEVDGKPFFASGMNLAWISFANDLNYFNASAFTQQCKALSAAGGNTLRWWLHTNGTVSPKFTNDTVSGITTIEINNLKRALDTAQRYNIRLVLCLWSFDMLQSNAGSGIARNKKLIEDSVATAAYIRNALTPMVNALKDHPAILCWEVCNEPEGMSVEYGWSTERTTMAAIQAWTNRIAGAIHRLAPQAKVSNGSWNIKVLTDVNGMYNYYRDDRLIAAGKDSLGTLDFYMVHYYNVHFGPNESPFHHPKSYWNLDKPLVIGEFPAMGMYGGQINTPISPIEAYNYAYNNGYAGALSWTMTAHDGNGGLTEAAPALENLVAQHADTLQIDRNQFNFSPRFVQRPNDIVLTNRQSFTVTLPLHQMITDPDDTIFTLKISNNTNTTLVNVTLSNDSVLTFSPNPSATGIALITLKVTDARGKSSTTYFNIYAPDTTSSNKALYRKATASDQFYNYYPYMVTDGKTSTNWWSYATTAQLVIEFEKPQIFNKVVLNWSDKYARKYNLEISDDGENWTAVANILNGKAGINTHTFNATTAKYLRINCLTRVSTNGYSLYELEVYYDSTLNAPQLPKQSFKMYPNPVREWLVIDLPSLKTNYAKANIINLKGQVVKTFSMMQPTVQIDVGDLTNGVYLLQIAADGTFLSQQFVKQ